MSSKMYCTNCGTELTDSQVQKLKEGGVVYCTECGMGFQAEKEQPTNKKPNIMGEFKKFGEKLGEGIKKTAQKVDSKIKEKKEDKQMASAPQPQPQPQYQYQYQEQPQPQPQPQPQYQQSTQSNQQRTGQGPSGPTFTASSSNSSSYRSTPPPPRQDFGSNLKRGFRAMFGIPPQLTPEQMEERNLRREAERNVMQRQFIQMHFLTFVLINAVLFMVNWFTNNEKLWCLWVIVSWGALMLIHAWRYLDSRMPKPIPFALQHTFYYLVIVGYIFFVEMFDGKGFTDPIKYAINIAVIWGSFLIITIIFSVYWGTDMVKRQMAESTRPSHLKMPVVISHILAYGIFNLIAFLVDTYYGLGSKWYYWTFYSWGVLVILHIIVSILYGIFQFSISGQILLLHIILYVFASVLMILFNIYTGVDFSGEITRQSILPITIWGIIVIIHFIIHIIWIKAPTSQDVDKEVERLRARKQQQ